MAREGRAQGPWPGPQLPGLSQPYSCPSPLLSKEVSSSPPESYPLICLGHGLDCLLGPLHPTPSRLWWSLAVPIGKPWCLPEWSLPPHATPLPSSKGHTCSGLFQAAFGYPHGSVKWSLPAFRPPLTLGIPSTKCCNATLAPPHPVTPISFSV